MTAQPLTPAAERKRQQRARAAAGQVHRVAVYLTEEERRMLDCIAQQHYKANDSFCMGMALIAHYQRLIDMGLINAA